VCVCVSVLTHLFYNILITDHWHNILITDHWRNIRITDHWHNIRITDHWRNIPSWFLVEQAIHTVCVEMSIVELSITLVEVRRTCTCVQLVQHVLLQLFCLAQQSHNIVDMLWRHTTQLTCCDVTQHSKHVVTSHNIVDMLWRHTTTGRLCYCSIIPVVDWCKNFTALMMNVFSKRECRMNDSLRTYSRWEMCVHHMSLSLCTNEMR